MLGHPSSVDLGVGEYDQLVGLLVRGEAEHSVAAEDLLPLAVGGVDALKSSSTP